MGTDIHIHVELRLEEGGRWVHWNAPHIKRNYALFTKLANVRGCPGVTPISNPRGLPADISELTHLARAEDDDCHSDSWISRDEIRQVAEWWERERILRDLHSEEWFEPAVMGGYLIGNGYTSDLPDWVADVRLVFWFDN